MNRAAGIVLPGVVTGSDLVVAAGRVVVGGLATPVRLPYDVPGTAIALVPAPLPHDAGESLLAVLNVLERCAPWCDRYVAPGVTEWGTPVLGVCRPGVIAVGLGEGVLSAMSTAHHEAWHAAEHVMRPDLVALVTAAVSRGVPRPGAYLPDPRERRARLYEAWAVACDEGYRVPAVRGAPVSPVDRVLWHVYTGGLAADVAGERARLTRRRPVRLGVDLVHRLIQHARGNLGVPFKLDRPSRPSPYPSPRLVYCLAEPDAVNSVQ